MWSWTFFHFLQTWGRALDLMLGGVPWTWREVHAATDVLRNPHPAASSQPPPRPHQPTRAQQQPPQQAPQPQQPPRPQSAIDFWPLEEEEEDDDVIVID